MGEFYQCNSDYFMEKMKDFIEKGKHSKAIEFAEKLLEKNVSVEKTALYVELPIEEVREIQRKLIAEPAKKEGVLQGLEMAAINMIKAGKDNEEITLITGIPESRVNKLREEESFDEQSN